MNKDERGRIGEGNAPRAAGWLADKLRAAGCLLTAVFLMTGCASVTSEAVPLPEASTLTETDSPPEAVPFNESAASAVNERKLASKHINEETFRFAVDRARDYNPEDFSGLIAGVVPHHLTAAPLIGGFFRAATEGASPYDSGPGGVNTGSFFDTVIIVGPNHSPNPQGGGEVVVSLKDWERPGGAGCGTETVNEIMKIKLAGGTITEDDARMENDHAVSALVPFVNRYWPEAEVAPVLVSGSLTLSDTLLLADGITEIISGTDKRVLLLCSIDFSHYLPPEESRVRDGETLAEIKKAGYGTIHSFTNANVDSPASLNIFLRYLKNSGGSANIIDNTDASEFTNIGNDGTTSYFVIAGNVKSS